VNSLLTRFETRRSEESDVASRWSPMKVASSSAMESSFAAMFDRDKCCKAMIKILKNTIRHSVITGTDDFNTYREEERKRLMT